MMSPVLEQNRVATWLDSEWLPLGRVHQALRSHDTQTDLLSVDLVVRRLDLPIDTMAFRICLKHRSQFRTQGKGDIVVFLMIQTQRDLTANC